MARRRTFRVALAAGALVIGVGLAWKTLAALHDDGPTVRATPGAQISDVYAWMTSDKTKVNLVMNVNPGASASTTFSTQYLYAFHLNSSTGYGTAATETKIICGFDAAQAITCWVGSGEVVTGNASATAGITSASGKTRVFAGPRDDPSFFNQSGFVAMRTTTTTALGSLTFDASGCPGLNAATSGALLNQLRGNASGGTATNDFAGQNVLSIVIQVDTTLVTPGGKILGVWASTHQKS
jgi:uncharacterized protein DUF4331